MRRLGALALAIMLITGCNAMKPNMEETEALSQWTVERYTAQAMAIQQRGTWREMLEDTDEPEITMPAIPAPTPSAEQATASPQEAKTSESKAQAAERQEAKPLEPETSVAVLAEEDPTPETKAESTLIEKSPAPEIDWPYPQITCPPKPTPIPQSEWPHITRPPEPVSTPEPEPDEQPSEEPTLVPVVPAPEPTEQPAEPDPTPVETPPAMPEPTPTPTGGYAVCSCGATLTPEEVLPHMKAHAMNGESHSCRAY